MNHTPTNKKALIVGGGMPPEKRAPILREFPHKVPHGIQFFLRAGIVEAPDPESLAAAAPRCTVFRVEGENL